MTDKTVNSKSISHPASFRDPQGYIVSINDQIHRFIGKKEQKNYDTLVDSGLFDQLVKKGSLVNHSEVKNPKAIADFDDSLYKLVKPEEIPFISYPYEWSFHQLKDAALLTLDILEKSIKKGMTLKDASAFNVQFIGSKPIFIDTTSFEIRENKPWNGYKQFCEHFIAPLALMSYNDQYLHKLSRTFLDGIPLEVAVKMLPKKTRLKPGLLQHLHIHAKSQVKHQKSGSKHVEGGAKKTKIPKMSEYNQLAIIDSLRRTVISLKPKKHETEWGDYYDFTNYNKKSFSFKHKAIDKLITVNKPKNVWDFGANNGEFSQIASKKGIYTIAFDIDPNAVSKNYKHFKGDQNMMPLLLDLNNPTPNLGWGLEERDSIVQRGPADLVMALALIHHLSIGSNVPFDRVAKFFSKCGKSLIIEFVPKGDSKVDSLLLTRKDIFDTYTQEKFEAQFKQYFTINKKIEIENSKRTLYYMKTK